jgi:hypothetical protein
MAKDKRNQGPQGAS